MSNNRSLHGARFRLTFRAWLYQHQQDGGAIGRVARAVMVDRCLLPDLSYTWLPGYQQHWQQVHGATPDDLAMLAEVWAIWSAQQAAAMAGGASAKEARHG